MSSSPLRAPRRRTVGFGLGGLFGGLIGGVTTAATAAPPPPPPPPGATAPAQDGAPPSNRPPPGRREADPESTPVIDQRVADTDLTTNWGYSEAKTELRPNYVRSERDSGLSVNPIGYYQGVSVEGVNLPPFSAPELGVQPTVLTWTGFERSANSSRAFFQLSSGVPYQVDRQGFIISIRLPNTSVSVRNNARRLDTSYFRTPLTELTVRRDGADLVLTMQLRREAAPTIGLRDGQNGYKVLVVEFPDTEVEQRAPAGKP